LVPGNPTNPAVELTFVLEQGKFLPRYQGAFLEDVVRFTWVCAARSDKRPQLGFVAYPERQKPAVGRVCRSRGWGRMHHFFEMLPRG
jgi:hypothetical protein